MQTHSLVQGSDLWHAHRRNFFNASDAPAMMNCSAYETRDQLIARLATGITPEVDAMTQRRFDEGHRFEALARPLAVEIIGEALFPVVGSEGKLSASFDGLTMAEDTAFEHKTLNNELRPCMRDSGNGWDLPLQYQVQMEQQLLVSGAERVLFMASKWDGDTLVEARHCWFASDPKIRAKIASGWAQLEKDVAAYTAPEATAPASTGRAPETLPALFVTIKGEVTASNLAEFKDVALAAIRNVNRELTTDQQFADAEKAVKWCTDIEERVAGAKQHALSQTATIDELFKALEDISAEARQTRLDLSKLVTGRKNSLKSELLIDAQTKLGDYLRECNKRIGRDYMPHVTADFAGAIHGKKSFDSMRAALNAALANAKIEASGKADLIQENMATLQQLASEHRFLFSDTSTIVLKANDDMTALVKTRIADHKAAEAAKEEATRERIRLEEVAKLQREQKINARIAVFNTAGEPLKNRPIEELQTILTTVRSTVLTSELLDDRVQEALAAKAAAIERIEKAIADASPAPLATAAPTHAPSIDPAMAQVRQVVRAAASPDAVSAALRQQVKADTPATLKLGEINARLQHMTVTAANLSALGFAPAAREKGAVLFHEYQYPQMCAALIQQIHNVSELQAA